MLKEVLFCDDQSQMLCAAEVKLRRHGLRVRRTQNGEEAWLAIQERRPDLVVTDCHLSYLGGVQLITRIRREPTTATLPILILTAQEVASFNSPASEIMQSTDVLCKPFSPRELCQRVQQVLEKSVSSRLPIADPQAFSNYPPATLR